MHEREDDLRWAPLVPGAGLTLLLALLGTCDAKRGVAAHALAGLPVLEAPWFFVAMWVTTRNSVSPMLVSLAVFAIAGVGVRLVVPRRWNSAIGIVAGLAWALCSCAVVAARV